MLSWKVPAPETSKVRVPRPLDATLYEPLVIARGPAAPPSELPLRLKSASPEVITPPEAVMLPTMAKRLGVVVDKDRVDVTSKLKLPLSAVVEKAVGSCMRRVPEPSLPVLSTSIMRPLAAMLDVLSEPRENAYLEVPDPVAIVRQPRLSEPTEYELPTELIGTLVCTPVLVLMSSTPAAKATLPVPSALNVPAMARGPLASKPWKKNAYCPFITDS